MQADALCFHFLRTTEQGHHRIHRIDADVHHRPIGQFRLEGIQHDAFLELVVARGVLAIAGKISTDCAQLLQVFLHDGEVGVEGRNHRFHQGDTLLPGGINHLSHFPGVRGERLFAQHMLAVAHAEDALFGMDIVRRGDIDRINQRTLRHFF